MGTLEIVRSYVAAWNLRSSEAVLATFLADGTYRDPVTAAPCGGDALAAYLTRLWQSFPDLSFDIVTLSDCGGGAAALEWVMRGTNNGPFGTLPPTGRVIELAGADFLTTGHGKLRSVVGYFDSGAIPRQLGLQVLVQPEAAGPFRFGYSVQVQTGKVEAPGAMGITVLEALDETQMGTVREESRAIMAEMLAQSGFIGATAGAIGSRMFTVTAWDRPESVTQLLHSGAHAAAMPAFFGGKRARSGFTSVWVPTRINPYWVRCGDCGHMAAADAGSLCRCGATLPPHPPYW